jgi:hypothetical protein
MNFLICIFIFKNQPIRELYICDVVIKKKEKGFVKILLVEVVHGIFLPNKYEPWVYFISKNK